MKKSHLTQLLAGLVLTFFSFTAWGVTLDFRCDITHNYRNHDVSYIQYEIRLSNGWTGYSAVSNLELKDDNSNIVYTHADNESPFGSLDELPKGHYLFTGSVTTLNEQGKYQSLSISRDIWIGMQSEWKNPLEIAVQPNSNVLKREGTTNLSYGAAQLYNTAGSGDEWVEIGADFSFRKERPTSCFPPFRMSVHSTPTMLLPTSHLRNRPRGMK